MPFVSGPISRFESALIKVKLETATGEARDKILYKIRRLSPWWTEPAKDDAVREAYYQEVFEEFVKFKVENNESIDNFTYDKFATKLRANTAELMKRPDVKDVQFSVYIKDGKVALKARVVRG